MIDKPSPSFEMALQEEFKRFYLAGIETGRRLERSQIQQKMVEGKVGYETYIAMYHETKEEADEWKKKISDFNQSITNGKIKDVASA